MLPWALLAAASLAPCFALELEAARGSACVRFTDGAVKCWGENLHGQLGYGDLEPRGDGPGEMGNNLPFVSLPGSLTSALMTGNQGHREHRCVVLSSGDLVCWGGTGFDGVLGNGAAVDIGDDPGEMGDSLVTVAWRGSARRRNIAQVKGGRWNTCVKDEDAELRCFGNSAVEYNPTGYGDRINRGATASTMGDALPAIDFGTGRTVADFCMAYAFGCALLDDATVKCFGLYADNLGYGDQIARGGAPGEMGDNLPAVDLGTGRSATAVSCTADSICVLLDNNGVKCWGWNQLGQLGYGDTEHRGGNLTNVGDLLPEVDLGTGLTVASLHGGRWFHCALFTNARVKCWGDNGFGTLGLGDVDHRGDEPGEMGDALPFVDLGSGRTVRTLRTGGGFACAELEDSKTVKCWGAGSLSQLPYGSLDDIGDDPGEMGDALPAVDFGDVETTSSSTSTSVSSSSSSSSSSTTTSTSSRTSTSSATSSTSSSSSTSTATTSSSSTSSSSSTLSSTTTSISSSTSTSTSTYTTTSSSSSTSSSSMTTSSSATTSTTSSTSTSSPSSTSSSASSSTSTSTSSSSVSSGSSSSTSTSTASSGTGSTPRTDTSTSSVTTTSTSYSSATSLSSSTSTSSSSFSSSSSQTTSTSTSSSASSLTTSSTTSTRTTSSTTATATTRTSWTSSTSTSTRTTSTSTHTSHSTISSSSSTSSSGTTRISSTSTSTASTSSTSSSPSSRSSLSSVSSSSATSTSTTVSTGTGSTLATRSSRSSTSTAATTGSSRSSRTSSSTTTSSRSKTTSTSSGSSSTTSSSSRSSASSTTTQSISSSTSLTSKSSTTSASSSTSSRSTPSSSSSSVSTLSSQVGDTSRSSSSSPASSSSTTYTTFSSSSSSSTTTLQASAFVGTTSTETSSSSSGLLGTTKSSVVSSSSSSVSSSSSASTSSTSPSSASTSSRSTVTKGTSPSSSSSTSVSAAVITASTRSTILGETTASSVSSASTTSTTTTTTLTWSVIAGSYLFSAAGCTVADVKTSCRIAVAAAADVEEDVVECTISLTTDSSRLLQTSGDETIVESLISYEASFVVVAPQEDAERVRTKLEDVSGPNATDFQVSVQEALISVVSNATVTSSTFQFGWVSLVDSSDAVTAFLFTVARQQAQVLDALLTGNATEVIVEIDGVSGVAARMSRETLLEAGGASYGVEGDFGVFVPLDVFNDLGRDDLVMVAMGLSDSFASLLAAKEDQAEGGESPLASLSINLFSEDGAALQVSNLSTPMMLNFAIEDSSSGTPSCAVWDEVLGEWSTEGLMEVGVVNGTLVCQTRHLSIFAALAKGFLSAFKCSQANLLSDDGFRNLRRSGWALEPTMWVLWSLLGLLAAMMVAASIVDAKRYRKEVWRDVYFLVPMGERPSADNADEETAKNAVKGGAVVVFFAGVAEGVANAGEIASEVVSEIANQFMESLFSYLWLLHELCSGLWEVLSPAHSEHASSHVQGGVMVGAIMAGARVAARKATHLSACAAAGIHHEDDYEAAVHELEESLATDVPSNDVPAADMDEKSAPEGDKGMQPYVSARSKRSGNFPSEAGGNGVGSRTVSSGSQKRVDTLYTLHQKHSRRLHEERCHLHRGGKFSRKMCKHFFTHGPIGSVFLFSIYKSSCVRALLFSCEVLGACAVSTFFMSFSGRTRSVRNPSSCNLEDDLAAVLGRLIAVGLTSAIVATVPVSLLGKLHLRHFVRVEYEGSPTWKRQLRVWRVLDVLLWLLGLGYAGFCSLYIMLFFANVAPADHTAWLVSAVTSLLEDLIFAPLMFVLIPPAIALLCIMLVACMTSQSRKEVVGKLHGTAAANGALQSDELSTSNNTNVAADASSVAPATEEGSPGNGVIIYDDGGEAKAETLASGDVDVILVVPTEDDLQQIVTKQTEMAIEMLLESDFEQEPGDRAPPKISKV